MNSNPILEELYAARQKLMDDAGGDLHRLIEQAHARALASGRPLVGPVVHASDQSENDRSNKGPTLDDLPHKP